MKRVVKAITPPILVAAARRLRRGVSRSRRLPEWEYVPEGWARANDSVRGWDVETVVDAYRSKLPAFGAAMLGSDPLAIATSAAVPVGEPSIFEQNTVLAFAYCLALASRCKDRLTVLDWGGGAGFSYLLSRAVLPEDVEIDYHCKDHPLVCCFGRDAVPEVNFWDDDSCLDRQYDLVFASSSLQYSEEWRPLLERLARASNRYLFLTRVPVAFRSPSFVVLQRAHVYETEYLSWVFNRQELLDAAARTGMALVREFLLGYKPAVVGAPEQDETRAYLFRTSTL